MPRRVAATDGGKRFPLNMRTTEAVRLRLEEAAKDSGRSLAQEVEVRLEQSFVEKDQELIDISKIPLVRMLTVALKQAELSTGELWYKSPEASAACRRLMLGVIDLMMPAHNSLAQPIGRHEISDQLDAADIALQVAEKGGAEANALLHRIEKFHQAARAHAMGDEPKKPNQARK